ncbi:MAG: hypothetical protein ACO1SV_13875 [Fimbriimonas sp.]
MLLFVAAMALSEPSLTVKFTSKPLPQALRLLSEASGQRLEAAPVLADEVLMVRFRDVPRKEALRRVADLYAAEWVAKPDGLLVLRPDAAKRRAAQAALLAKAKDTLRGSFAYNARRLAQQPERFGPQEAAALEKKRRAEEDARKRAEEAKDYERMFLPMSSLEETPAWRALARLLPTLGEAKLLAMPPSAREVWAENPTVLQNPFPIGARQILQRYREELGAQRPDAQAVRVKVVMNRWEHGEAHNAHLVAMDAAGKKVDEAAIRLNNDMDRMKTPLSQRDPIPPAGNESPLKLSEETLEHLHVAGRSPMSSTPENARLLAKWLPILQNPERYEPTGWLPSEGFVAAAEALDRNLVGAASEIPATDVDQNEERLTPSQFLAKNTYGVTQGTDGWITVTPGEPRSRVPRARGGVLLRDAAMRGGLAIDTASAFAAASPDIWPFTNWVNTALGVMFTGGGPNSFLTTTNDDTLLRFWHQLGPENHRLLRNGETLSLQRLPLNATSMLRRMIFDEVRLGEETDPTEIFTRTFEGDLTLRVEEVPLIRSWRDTDGEASAPFTMSAEQYGQVLAVGNRYREMPAEKFRAMNRFRLGRKRVYHLDFGFRASPTILKDELIEVFFDPKGSPVDRLPAAVAARVEEARLKALAAPVAKPDGGGVPPPR